MYETICSWAGAYTALRVQCPKTLVILNTSSCLFVIQLKNEVDGNTIIEDLNKNDRRKKTNDIAVHAE